MEGGRSLIQHIGPVVVVLVRPLIVRARLSEGGRCDRLCALLLLLLALRLVVVVVCIACCLSFCLRVLPAIFGV